ncbi:Retrovirus-related Pol polyprotein from type-1 retrotransposable element R2, partial [Durusdinium trenchii]
MEEKKKVIMDSEGRLEYDKVVSSLKLLGSKLFSELQNAKTSTRTKTYETVNTVDEDDHTTAPHEDEAFNHEAWDDWNSEATFLAQDENDQDALIVSQFEDSLIDVLQSDPDTASCYHTYLEARRRIIEKGKNRGSWPIKGAPGGKPKPKGKFSPTFTKGKGFRKPLAQRILESECRRCGQRGHWKAECPKRFEVEAKTTPAPTAFAGNVMIETEGGDTEADDMILISEVTRQSAEQHEEQAFLHLNVEELDHHKIDFGKEKKGQTYLKVVQEDPQPRYTALFTSTYKNSTKGPHRKFIHYVSLYTDRLEQQLAEEKTPETQPKNQPKSRRPIMTSPREWQDRTPSSSPSPSQKSSHWEMIRE